MTKLFCSHSPLDSRRDSFATTILPTRNTIASITITQIQGGEGAR